MSRLFAGLVRPALLASFILSVASGCLGAEAVRRRDALRARAAEAPLGGASDDAALLEVVTLDRDRLIAEILARNPSVAAARAGVRAALSLVDERRAFPDPMVRAGTAPASWVTPFVGGPSPGVTVGVAQRLLWPQKLSLAGEAALAEAEAAQDDVEALRLKLGLAASLLYDEYWLSTRAAAVQGDVIALARQNEATAIAAYGAGRGSQQDPIQAEVERIQAERLLVLLEGNRAASAARLNALLHRPPSAPLPPPPDELRPPAATTADEDQALHPSVRAEHARLASAQKAHELAQWSYVPDVEVNASYSSMWAMWAHQLSVGVAFELPLELPARAAKVDAARARAARAQRQIEAAHDEVAERAEVARIRLAEAVRVEALLREQLLPAARDRAAAALAGYESGESTFDVFISAEHLRHDVALELLEAQAEISRGRARLLEALGRLPLTSEEDGLDAYSADRKGGGR